MNTTERSKPSLIHTTGKKHIITLQCFSGDDKDCTTEEVCVLNARSLREAIEIAEQAVLGEHFEMSSDQEKEIVRTDLVSATPADKIPEYALITRRELVSAPGPRQIRYVECSREESLHGEGTTTSAYFSDGVTIHDWLADSDHGLEQVAQGIFVYVRPIEGFKLEPKAVIANYAPVEPLSVDEGVPF